MTFSAYFLAFLLGFYQPAPVQTAFLTYDCNFYNKLEYTESAFQTSYEYKCKSIDAKAGFCFSKNNFEMATDFSIYFYTNDVFGAGFNGIYHFKTYENTFNEHDVIIGGEVYFNPVKWFKLTGRTGYLITNSEIIPLRPYNTQWVCNNSVYLFFRLDFMPVENLKLYLSSSNCELFHYNLLGSASFIIGAEYAFDFGLVFRAEAASRWIDIITLSGRYDSTDLRVSAGYRW